MKPIFPEPNMVIDAREGTLGRIASFVAKQALLGKIVVIINCNEARITGNKKTILAKFLAIKRKGGASLKGPKFINSPERIMKRAIRGMLSHKQSRGSEALDRIRCYNKVPKEYENIKAQSFPRPIPGRFLTLKEVTSEL